jgi:hypothetical protein
MQLRPLVGSVIDFRYHAKKYPTLCVSGRENGKPTIILQLH